MSDEIDEFIRRAAERRKQTGQSQRRTARPAQPATPPPASPQYRPRARLSSLEAVDAEVVSAEVVEDVASHVNSHLDNRQFQQRAAQMGEEPGLADDKVEARLHQTFDHQLGRLGQSSSLTTQLATARSATDVAAQVTTAGTNDMLSFLLGALRSPQHVRQAIILSDILARPNIAGKLIPLTRSGCMAVSKIVPGQTRLGWIGTGVMGQSMCGHLIAAGFPMTVYSRTRAKAEGLVSKGAKWAESPQQVAQQSDVVFSIVGFPRDVREVVLGATGALAGAQAGSILVDMTTSEPSLAREIYETAKHKNVHSVDAPVSGGDVGAKEARLSIMIGGDQEVVDALDPCFAALGKTIIYQGAAGAGQHTKMTNQILIASNMVGVCEALLYAHRAGLDLNTVMQSVTPGAAGSWSLSNLGPRIIANNFDPGFFVEHFIKDMGIALDEANRMGLSLPGLALSRQLYIALQSQGQGRAGTHALQLALASLSGIDWKARQ